MKMVLKFEDYIKEGFMSKTYDRLKNGENRSEDKTKFTEWLRKAKINEVRIGDTIWLDVPFGEMNGDVLATGDFLTAQEVKDLDESLPKGYRIAKYRDFSDLFKNSTDTRTVMCRVGTIRVSVFKYNDQELKFPHTGFLYKGEICKDGITYPRYYFFSKDHVFYSDICMSSAYVSLRRVSLEDTHALPVRIIKESVEDDGTEV